MENKNFEKLKKYSREELCKKRYSELLDLCFEYGLSTTGHYNIIVERLLRAHEEHEKKINKKRFREQRLEEIELLKKKRKIETENFIIMCNRHLPIELLMNILQYLPRNKMLLDTIGIVNSLLYVQTRSKEMWDTMIIRASKLYVIPVPMIKECSRIILKEKFSSIDIGYLMKIASNVRQIEVVDGLSAWTDATIKKLFSKKSINSKLKSIILNGMSNFKNDRVIRHVIDKVTSNELQVLILNNIQISKLSGEYVTKKIGKQYPNLRWFELKRWFTYKKNILLHILENCKNLRALSVDAGMLDVFDSIHKTYPLEYLQVAPASDYFTSYVQYIENFIQSALKWLPNLKVLSVANVTKQTMELICKLPNLEELKFHGDSENVEYISWNFPKTVKRLTVLEQPIFSVREPQPQVLYLETQILCSEQLTSLIHAFPNLQILIVKSIKKEWLSKLGSLVNLRSLIIQGEITFQDDQIWKEIAKTTKLSYISISGKPKEGFDRIYELPPVVPMILE